MGLSPFFVSDDGVPSFALVMSVVWGELVRELAPVLP